MPSVDTVDTGFVELPFSNEVVVTVTLDGEPVQDAWVSVGGGMNTRTDEAGLATMWLDGGRWIIASHPEARTAAWIRDGSVRPCLLIGLIQLIFER